MESDELTSLVEEVSERERDGRGKRGKGRGKEGKSMAKLKIWGRAVVCMCVNFFWRGFRLSDEMLTSVCQNGFL